VASPGRTGARPASLPPWEGTVLACTSDERAVFGLPAASRQVALAFGGRGIGWRIERMRGRIGRQVTVADGNGDEAGGDGGGRSPADPVLHVITSSQRRGAETFAVDLAAALGDRGAASEVVALAPGAGDTLDVATLGPSALGPSTLRALRRRAAGAPALIAHGSSTLPACALALAGHRTPVVYRSIGDPGAWAGGPVRRLRTRALLGRMVAVTALWPAAADAVHDLYGVPRARLHVLPNGVPAARCPVPDEPARAAARARLGLPPGASVVAAIGALSAEKRVADAVDAAAKMDGAHLLVAGDGPERPALEHRAAAALGDRAHFAGVLTGPGDALAASDVVVSCSRTEGMPGVLIEAGLSGLPAVATDVGGVAQIVRDGETGVLVRPGDVDGLTAGLVRALAERSRLGAAARAHCLATFEIGPVADGWRDLLRTLGVARSHT
jgi:glycosyltransferase involved in cell wall biosynthesis